MNENKTIIKRIPGEIPPQPKKSNQGYIGDLSEKQTFELEELLARQNKLLSNKAFIKKLPDKGEKLCNLKDKLECELQRRDEIENAAKLLSRLNIVTEGKAAMAEMEWTGKYNEKSKNDTEKIVELDSDDEENPLKILAQPTGSGTHKKKVIHLGPEESLIKPEDLEEIESFKENPMELEHVKYIVQKVENPKIQNREKFKPYKTTKSNVHESDNEKLREDKLKKIKNWEVTAATPPSIIHGPAITIDLNESLRLQKEQATKLQELQVKHAAERLMHQFGHHNLGDMPQNVGIYRSQNIDDSGSSSSEDEDKEVYDEEDNDRQGTVSFPVDSIES